MEHVKDLAYFESLKYAVTVYFSEEDNCWIAELPELEGVIADAETPEEALKKVLEIKDTVLELSFKYEREQYIAEPVKKEDATLRTLFLSEETDRALRRAARKNNKKVDTLVFEILTEFFSKQKELE